MKWFSEELLKVARENVSFSPAGSHRQFVRPWPTLCGVSIDTRKISFVKDHIFCELPCGQAHEQDYFTVAMIRRIVERLNEYRPTKPVVAYRVGASGVIPLYAEDVYKSEEEVQ